ncbi:Sodium/hydrogen exchanger [Quillaja saponaria]|uniref:Sodium/hydrogen exchanger n=1 Tax=Quillaja saponaria TaxID=32244 RepID=A0AAD7PN82_QUISA|nr:Sodium/hydrogen exchanger [Quillaja saponaria]
MEMVLVSDLGRNLAHEHAQVVPISLFVAILCFCLVIGHLLEENRWLNESITAILVGFIDGTIILFVTKGKSSHILTFSEELFFIYLLPPIIFNAGFQRCMEFTFNFPYSVDGLGCWWLFPKLNFLGLTVWDYLAIGTIFSSTDTVCTLQVLHQDKTPLLYSLVFGEGVVNDTTSVVLFNAVPKLDVSRVNGGTPRVFGDFLYLFSLSTALGTVAGLLTAYVLKALCFGRHSSVREIALMMLMAYLSYMLAELLELSGILTVFFCGILMSRYAWHNVTESSRITARHVFATMSFIAETFIILYVGMDALDIEKWRMTKLSVRNLMGIYSSLISLILLGRAAFVFPLSTFSNYMNRRDERSLPITFKHQIIICWARLMRGAVSIALAFKQFTFYGVTSDPVNATVITNTIIVVLFSTLEVCGFLAKPLINYLLPHCATRKSISRQESKTPVEDMNLPMLSLEESAETNINRAKESLFLLIESPVYTIHSCWRRFDDAYMRPIFGGPCSSRQPEC